MADEQPQYPVWWLQPLLTLISQVVIPAVIAGVLLWFVLFRLDDTLKIIQREESERTKLILVMQDNLLKALEHQTDKFTDSMQANTEANKRIAEVLDRRKE